MDPLTAPDAIQVQSDPSGPYERDRGAVTVRDGNVTVATSRPVSRVRLAWRRGFDTGTVVLGDALERSYGDLGWAPVRAGRTLPWYCAVHGRGRTFTAGVRTGAGSFATWSVGADEIELVLDVRNGGLPVELGSRELVAATIVSGGGDGDPWDALVGLVDAMGPEVRPTHGPFVGANNWYYAYGEGFDRAAVLTDARTVVELADGHPVRPFSVIDDGWNPGRAGSGGPWDRGTPGVFDDMAALADDIRAIGARPGIWYRPLLSRDEVPGVRAVAGDPGSTLDPTHPAAHDRIEADAARFAEWGYDLVKHDFSTRDLLGTWGDEATAWGGFHDRGLTTAEVATDLYRRIRDAMPGVVVLGCNTIGHLAAGHVDVQRAGDDTSGRDWARTRRMGVNTLAFRLPQHGRFFAIDADCVPCTPATPWERNRQFLDLVARSGTALFVSVDPASRTGAVDADLSAAIRLALDGGEPGLRPVDWMDTLTPSR